MMIPSQSINMYTDYLSNKKVIKHQVTNWFDSDIVFILIIVDLSLVCSGALAGGLVGGAVSSVQHLDPQLLTLYKRCPISALSRTSVCECVEFRFVYHFIKGPMSCFSGYYPSPCVLCGTVASGATQMGVLQAPHHPRPFAMSRCLAASRK